MTVDEIVGNVHGRLGIVELNAMQIAVKASRKSKLILLAPTGSGKTVAFSIALLRSWGRPSGIVRGVVLAPSRELVIQISEVIKKLASGYKTVAFYGGHSMREEQNSLSQTPDIIVATPGRMLDHIQRKTVDVAGVESLVIDEYDKSLELGFQDEMRRIVRRMGRLKTIVLTSATDLPEMPDFVDMSGCETIDSREREGSALRPKLHVARVESPSRDKAQTLVDLLKSLDDGRVMVFVNHRESAERTYEILRKAGMPVGLYHGGLEQQQRETALKMLDNGSTPILVTTDLGSRGLDIEGLSAVVHYHLPVSEEAWTHRNGRTARAGAAGEVFVITSEADNLPDYVVWDNDYHPTGKSGRPVEAHMVTLYINAGKKEKISKGDVVGFLCQKGGLTAAEIGKIDLSDHYVLVAVEKTKAAQLLEVLAPEKLKGKRVRVSAVRG